MRINSKLQRACAHAESQRLRVVGSNDVERKILKRRMMSGELVRVYGRCYARVEYKNARTRDHALDPNTFHT